MSKNLLTCLTTLPFLQSYCEKVGGSYLSGYGLISNLIGYGGLHKKSLSLGILALSCSSIAVTSAMVINHGFAFCGHLPSEVSSLSVAFTRLCWLPFSLVSAFSWRISSISYCWVCYIDCIISIKRLALSLGFLCCCCGLAPRPFVPSA